MEQQAGGRPKTQDWFHRWILFGLMPYPKRLRWGLLPARAAQRLGLVRLAEAVGLVGLMPERLRQLVRMLPPAEQRLPELPTALPALGPKRARVALFTGCVGQVLFPGTHWATARVLQRNGCEVVVPRDQVCCGAIHFHAGSAEPARALADANLRAFADDSFDAIVTNIAGCGAMLKDYGHHWHDDRAADRQRFAGRVKDVHEFLDELGLVPPAGPVRLTATYHDACHLGHAQRITEAPRKLLRQIPGLTLRELPETQICCGAAGTYNLTEPEMAGRLGRRKLNNILATGAQVCVTANTGCILQIGREARQQGRRLRVVHPMDLLDESYRNATG